MKKVTHVFFDEYPKDSRIRRYCNALNENNYKIYVICLKSSRLPLFEKHNSVFVYRIPMQKRRGSFFSRFLEYLVFQLLATMWVSFIELRHHPSIYHFHTLPDFLVFAALLPKLFGKKIVLDFHELFPEFMMQHRPKLTYNSPVIKLVLFLERISFKFANRRIAFHDPAKSVLLNRIQGNETIVIMNGVDEGELPTFHKYNTDRFKLVYNGTINYNLNLSLVLKTFDFIRSANSSVFQNLEFHLYGSGPDLVNILDLKNQLNLPNVFYHGQLPFTKMIKELESASACILPPKKDIYSDLYYSIKLTEMIYFRIPVISTRLYTYLYYYPENCILYFNSGDKVDLANKIVYAFENELSHFTTNAWQHYRKISWDKMKSRYLLLLENMLDCQNM